MSRLKKIRLGITLGDPAGIGPQILSEALKRITKLKNVEFVVIGDGYILERFNFPKKDITLIDLNHHYPDDFSFGKLDPLCGRFAIDYLDRAVGLIKNKLLDCLVTLPINKEAVNRAGFIWLGHTEYLADAFGVKEVVMLLLNRFLKVALVTRHLAIKEVAKNLSKEEILKTILLVYEGLKNYFNIKNPKIGICALNPHASDGGMFGNEEERIILPAIEEAKAIVKEIDISGPLPSDALFLKAKKGNYNVVIAMYHDQALIALKLTDFLHGVNFTLGLPFVRTSPLHGTALDIAGKRKASCISLIEAVHLAIQCTLNFKKKTL